MSQSLRYGGGALVVLVGAALCWGRPAPAQQLPELRLPPGRQIKLQLVDSSLVLGRLVETLPDRVVVRTLVGAGKPFSHYRNRDVAVDSIARAWVHGGTRWRTGALIGAGTGVLAPLVIGIIAAGTQDPGSCDVGCWIEVESIFAAAGALMGAFVGYQFTIWRLALPEPR